MRPHSWPWTAAFAAALIAGAVLRLVWIEDMEYKADEAYMHAAAQQYRSSHVLPRVGNRASIGLPNPGVSTWPFIVPARLFGWSSPLDLARLVQVSAIVALLLLTYFARRWVNEAEREPWLWAIALASVNPLAIVMQRKIWTPSILPIFLVIALMGWWRADSRWGALLWGVVGCVVAQIQLGGVFLMAGLAGWALLFDRRRVRWLAWLAGVSAGAVLSLPWAIGVLAGRTSGISAPRLWFRVRYWRFFILRPLGFGLDFSLGPAHREFLAQPAIGGTSTYLVLAAYVVCGAVGVLIAVRALVRGWRAPASLLRLIANRSAATPFTAGAAAFGVGLAFFLTGVPIHRHYIEVVFPLPFVWLAWVALMPPVGSGVRVDRALLAALCVAQITLAAAFLAFVHERGGAPGDYGVSYRAQRVHGSP